MTAFPASCGLELGERKLLLTPSSTLGGSYHLFPRLRTHTETHAPQDVTTAPTGNQLKESGLLFRFSKLGGKEERGDLTFALQLNLSLYGMNISGGTPWHHTLVSLTVCISVWATPWQVQWAAFISLYFTMEGHDFSVDSIEHISLTEVFMLCSCCAYLNKAVLFWDACVWGNLSVP